jgi:SAM-dependent methyltransferase
MNNARDTYRAIYQEDLEHEAHWLRYCAVAKVDSVASLLARHDIRPRNILELGCGTGAVIAECKRRNIARDLVAIDYSPEAIRVLSETNPDIRAFTADIADDNFRLHEEFDVVVLSHVLEHLEQPLKFLSSLTRKVRFRYLVAEVPLEDLWAARVKMLVRNRSHNAAGHVQFFTASSFQRLLSSAGLRMISERRYVPVLSRDILRTQRERGAYSRVGEWLRLATNNYLPRLLRPLWERVYYAHYAVLCAPHRQGP